MRQRPHHVISHFGGDSKLGILGFFLNRWDFGWDVV